MKLPAFVYSEKLTYRKEIKQILGIKMSFPRVKKTIAFVETRGLGDYIVMHNFLKNLKESKKYQDYNIILIIRKNIASLAEAYDSLYVDEILYVDGRADMLKNLKVEELVCLYDGNFKFEKLCFKKIKAKKKTICSVDTKSAQELCFRTKTLKKIFENLIEEKIEDFSYPYFDNTNTNIKNNSIFISPFANSDLRTWKIEKYAALINKITKNYPNDIVILGEHPNKQAVDNLISMCNDRTRIINAAGKFSINALYDHFRYKCAMLIANETGTVHLAAGANTNIICISNGSHYSVWTPYEKPNIKYIFPPEFQYTPNHTILNLDINNINTENVYAEFESLMKQQPVCVK